MGLVTLLFLSALAWAFGTLPGRYWTSYLGLTSDLHLRSRLLDSSEAVATLQTWRWDADFEEYLLGQANDLMRLSHELERAEEQVFENLQAHLPDWEPLQQEPLSRLLGKVQQILSSSHNLYLEAWLNEPLSLGEMLEMALASGQGSLSALLPSFAGVIELRSKAPLLSSLGISHISEILDQRLLLKDGESLGPMGKAQLQEILSVLELESHKVQGAPFVRIRHQEWGLTAYAYLPDRRHLAFGSQPELVLSFVDKIKSSPLRGSLAETSSIELFVDVQKIKNCGACEVVRWASIS